MQHVLSACPHCQASGHGGGAFCAACGLALPGPRKPPRIVGESGYAQSDLGLHVQSGLMEQKAKAASTILLVIGVLQVIGAVAIVLLGGGLSGGGQTMLAALVTGGVVLIVALGFFGLAFWARTNPLPPSTIGLTVFVTFAALDAVLDPANLARGLFIKIIIVVALAKAVQAGIKHRELRRLAGASTGAP